MYNINIVLYLMDTIKLFKIHNVRDVFVNIIFIKLQSMKKYSLLVVIKCLFVVLSLDINSLREPYLT